MRPSKEFSKPGVPYSCLQYNTIVSLIQPDGLSRIFLHCNVNMIIKISHTTITCRAYNKLICLSKSISVIPPATVQIDPPILEFVAGISSIICTFLSSPLPLILLLSLPNDSLSFKIHSHKSSTSAGFNAGTDCDTY